MKPSALTNWRSVVQKERVGSLAYALYASTAVGQPAGSVFTSAQATATGTPVARPVRVDPPGDDLGRRRRAPLPRRRGDRARSPRRASW